VVKRAIVMAISVVLALAVAAPIASGQTAPQRQDLKALTEAWWTWATAVPSPLDGSYSSPDPRCEGEFVDGVFFLAGTTGGGPVERTCTVPADTALFFPVINSFTTAEEPNYPWGPHKVVAKALANGDVSATLDGEDLKIERIATGPFTITFLDPNIFSPGVPGGPYPFPAVSDGLWVYLPEGLEPGEYALHFEGTSVRSNGNPFSVDVTYNLIVV
jgi:hypothetical protein